MQLSPGGPKLCAGFRAVPQKTCVRPDSVPSAVEEHGFIILSIVHKPQGLGIESYYSLLENCMGLGVPPRVGIVGPTRFWHKDPGYASRKPWVTSVKCDLFVHSFRTHCEGVLCNP
jgi:hypothetical protein